MRKIKLPSREIKKTAVGQMVFCGQKQNAVSGGFEKSKPPFSVRTRQREGAAVSLSKFLFRLSKKALLVFGAYCTRLVHSHI